MGHSSDYAELPATGPSPVEGRGPFADQVPASGVALGYPSPMAYGGGAAPYPTQSASSATPQYAAYSPYSQQQPSSPGHGPPPQSAGKPAADSWTVV